MRLLLPFLTLCTAIYLNPDDSLYEEYMTLDQIEYELEEMVKDHPASADYNFDLLKSRILTENGNALSFMTISDQQNIDDWVVVVCGLDGSDWAAVTACMNLLRNPAYYGFPQRLQEGQEKPSSGFLSSVNLLVVPVANPDGYEYTFSDDRNWNKNRAGTTSPLCTGVYLEKNFNSKWCEDELFTCSTNPCSADYAGPAAVSEPEIEAIMEEVQNLGNIKTWITVNQRVNSNGHNIAYSSSLDEYRQSGDRHEIFLAEKFANAMTRHSGDKKSSYTVGKMDEQHVTGSSVEWAQTVADYS